MINVAAHAHWQGDVQRVERIHVAVGGDVFRQGRSHRSGAPNSASS